MFFLSLYHLAGLTKSTFPVFSLVCLLCIYFPRHNAISDSVVSETVQSHMFRKNVELLTYVVIVCSSVASLCFPCDWKWSVHVVRLYMSRCSICTHKLLLVSAHLKPLNSINLIQPRGQTEPISVEVWQQMWRADAALTCSQTAGKGMPHVGGSAWQSNSTIGVRISAKPHLVALCSFGKKLNQPKGGPQSFPSAGRRSYLSRLIGK